jgi:hypothetical protein
MSHDLEDIVTIVDGRPELILEVNQSELSLQKYISAEVNKLLGSEAFLDALPGHLLPDAASQSRISIIQERLRALVSA